MKKILTILSLSTALVSLVLPSIAFADSSRSEGAPGQAVKESGLPPGPGRGAFRLPRTVGLVARLRMTRRKSSKSDQPGWGRSFFKLRT
jgi:hypothetical protein